MTLAKIYSARNEKAKAMEYLKKVKDFIGFTFFGLKILKIVQCLTISGMNPDFQNI